MAEINFIDGLSFFSDTSGTPNTSFNIDSFGELKNGVWIPIEYTGSYGTNGFRLQFNQTGTGTASSSTIGADTSGNANHFTSSGIVASDCDMPDSPENNFATLNPLRHNISGSESDGNLRYVNTATSSEHRNYGTFGLTSGKFYWEGRCEGTNPDAQIGLGGVSETLTSNTYRISYKSSNGATVGLSGATYSTFGNGDIIGVAYDADNTQITFYKNNTAQTGSPVSITADTQGMFPMLITYNEGSTSNSGWIMNFGQDSSFVGNETAQGNTDGNGIGDFYYSPPSGYLALCTSNLPEPTISPNADTQADDYFNTVLYTGTYAPISITGVGFQPDWVWIKKRNGSAEHILTDSLRGAGKFLASQTTTAERTSSSQITSFDSDGFSMSSGDSGTVNGNGDTYVSWNWKAGGTAVSNTDGSITSSVSANTDAGFSIVTYTGTRTSDAGETGTPTTIGHGLGKKPAVVITKARETTTNARWNVWHQGYQPDQTYLNYQIWLNQTDGSNNAGWQRTDTGFSTTTFCPARYSWDDVLGIDYVAYCFAEIDGYSKFGSYTGNDASDGNMIFTNFSPALVIIKYTSGTAGGTKNWYMWDNTRSPQNTNDNILYSNTSDQEGADSAFDIDFLSNGFKLRNAEGGVNNGAEYIYMAWASTPFKYSTAQ